MRYPLRASPRPRPSRILGGAAVTAVALIAGAVGWTIWKTRNYYWKSVERALEHGYTERQVSVREGLTLNFAESPALSHGRTPLLLIPGQGSIWQDYARVLPALSREHHVIAVDVHGHGKSTWNPDDYTCVDIADDLDALALQVFGRPYVISGHSSGGLIAARMAAAHPDKVQALLIEDAPFFATDKERVAGTFVGQDNHLLASYFDEPAESREPDYLVYSLPDAYIGKLFGDLWPALAKDVIRQRREDPQATPVIPILGETINRIWESLSHPYDPQWSNAFFVSRSWHEGYDQAATLEQISAPTLFLKATTNYQDGILLAALDDDDLACVQKLLPHMETHRIKAGHDIHFEKPEWFVEQLRQLTEANALDN